VSGPLEVLRDGLLADVGVVVAGPVGVAPTSTGAEAARACALLGARVAECRVGAGELLDAGEEAALDLAAAAAIDRCGGADVVLVDGDALFVLATDDRARLATSLQGTWALARALANAAFLEPGRAGRLLLIAPDAARGEHAAAARAAVENLARTLGTEWARHRVSAVALAPADGFRAAETATLVAYLASAAGAYFSGCVIGPVAGPVGPS
jgi:NAD(P)-dependent dehydrogenase (short-subunit alcohol dehydrogenase family)